MAFLTIGGVNVEIATSPASAELLEVAGGMIGRAFDGQLLGSRVATKAKRRWRFVTGPLTDAIYATFVAACPPTGTVSVTGTGVFSATIVCVITVTDVKFIQDGLGKQRVLTLDLEEV